MDTIAKKQANFFLSIEVVDLLQTRVSKGKQSQFVENALHTAFSGMKFQDALQTSFGAWKNRRQSTEQYVRKLRTSQRHTR